MYGHEIAMCLAMSLNVVSQFSILSQRQRYPGHTSVLESMVLYIKYFGIVNVYMTYESELMIWVH